MVKTEFHYGSSEFGGENVFFGARICELEVLTEHESQLLAPWVHGFCKKWYEFVNLGVDETSS